MRMFFDKERVNVVKGGRVLGKNSTKNYLIIVQLLYKYCTFILEKL